MAPNGRSRKGKGKAPAFTSSADGRLRGRRGSLQNFPNMPLDIIFEARSTLFFFIGQSSYVRLRQTGRRSFTSSGCSTPRTCFQRYAHLLHGEELPVVVEDCSQERQRPSRVPQRLDRARLRRPPLPEILSGKSFIAHSSGFPQRVKQICLALSRQGCQVNWARRERTCKDCVVASVSCTVFAVATFTDWSCLPTVHNDIPETLSILPR